MACATLKRSLDWEALNQRPAKRRRCLPFGANPSSPTTSTKVAESSTVVSPFLEASSLAPKLTPGKIHKYHLLIKHLSINVLFVEKMAENIREEIRRLHRRKQLSFNNSVHEQMQDSDTSGSEMGAESPRRPDTPPTAIKNPDMALFTFKQVSIKLHLVLF